VGISSLLSRVAAANGKDRFLGDAATGNASADEVSKLTREPARIDLALATDATPAHTIVIVVTALNGASSALVVEQNASEPL